jgi:HAD superfamily hydrolase (TIGR01549 family)
MKTMYKAVIFDLDDTLLNFSSCETESMKRTCNDHNLFIDDAVEWNLFWRNFSNHNYRHWTNFINGGELKTIGDVLRYSFRDCLNLEELFHSNLSDTYWDYFCNSCFFEEGAEQILSIFKDKFPLGLITNGISESQRKRLRAGNIDKLFTSIVIADEVGIRKPQKEIFEIALNDFKLSNKEVLFVGDSLQSDYQGAVNSGIDFCFYNRQNIAVSNHIKPKYRIKHLLDLVDVVGL